MRPLLRRSLALFAADGTSTQPENLFHSLSIAPRRRRGSLPRYEMLDRFDTLPQGKKCRLRECDESDDAYSCRGLPHLVHTPRHVCSRSLSSLSRSASSASLRLVMSATMPTIRCNRPCSSKKARACFSTQITEPSERSAR